MLGLKRYTYYYDMKELGDAWAQVGLDVAAHAARIMAGAFGDRMSQPGNLEALVEAGRLGRKSGKGFYDYSGKKKRPDRGVLEVLGERPAGSNGALRWKGELTGKAWFRGSGGRPPRLLPVR